MKCRVTLSCWECTSVDDGTRMSRTTSIGNSRPMRCALPSIADTATRRQFISGRVQTSASFLSAALPKLRPLFTSCRVSTVLLLSKSGLLLPKYGAMTREQGISNQLRASCPLGPDPAWAVPVEQAQRKKRRGFTHKAARQMRRTVGLNRGPNGVPNGESLFRPNKAARSNTAPAVAGQSWFAKGIGAGYYRTSTCNWLRQGNP